MTGRLRAVAVFCGSSRGSDPAAAEAAADFGRRLARGGTRLVYGGGRVGLMGVVADATLAAGGAVTGVITRALDAREVAHGGLSELRVVETMHERKAAMADAADAFVMLPGGFGTWEEFTEAVTWTQLGIHTKACGVLDVAGFYQPLVNLVAAAVENGFVRPQHAGLVIVERDPAALLDRLAAWQPPAADELTGPTGGPGMLGPGQR
ncbi:MAG TPA: TIGR00730 family Rossman fold protein [Acidimicrobiales bacterium]|nr:TIGR00730 family Rossman fold protein [Acidimicrobiales bacterium]